MLRRQVKSYFYVNSLGVRIPDWPKDVNGGEALTESQKKIITQVYHVGGGDLFVTNFTFEGAKVPCPVHASGYSVDFGLPSKDGQPDLSVKPALLRTFFELSEVWSGGVGIAFPVNLHLHVDDRSLYIAHALLPDGHPQKIYPSPGCADRSRARRTLFVENWSSGSLQVEAYSPLKHDAVLLSVYGLPKTWLEQFRESVKQTISDTADDVGQWIDNRFDAILPDAGFGWGVFVGLGLSAAGLYAWHKHGPGLAKAVPLIVDAARTRKKLFRLKKKAG